MEGAELVYKVQQLSQAAGLAYNENHPVECEALLVELRDLLIDQNFVTEKAETPPPAEETETDQPEQAPPGEETAEPTSDNAETEQSEQDTPGEETQDEPGPESQPSEQ